jgi:hypothetical protein
MNTTLNLAPQVDTTNTNEMNTAISTGNNSARELLDSELMCVGGGVGEVILG